MKCSIKKFSEMYETVYRDLYRQIRKEKEELLIAKRTVETILNIDRQKEQEKEQEKEEKKNFR